MKAASGNIPLWILVGISSTSREENALHSSFSLALHELHEPWSPSPSEVPQRGSSGMTEGGMMLGTQHYMPHPSSVEKACENLISMNDFEPG